MTMYRSRIVLNGPIDREHIFHGLPMNDKSLIEQQLADIRPFLVGAMSVTIQQFNTTSNSWNTLSPLGLLP